VGPDPWLSLDAEGESVGVHRDAALGVVRRNLERRWDVVSVQKTLLGRWRHLRSADSGAAQLRLRRCQDGAILARFGGALAQFSPSARAHFKGTFAHFRPHRGASTRR
jgi:hypothetical protein